MGIKTSKTTLDKGDTKEVSNNRMYNQTLTQLTTCLNEYLEVDKSTNGMVFDINGNNLAIIEIDSIESMQDLGKQIFENYKNLDSIIFLQKQEQEYNFYVYERDGSLSAFCGNGAIGAMYFLNKKYGKKSIELNTKYGLKTNVSTSIGRIAVQFPKSTLTENKQIDGIGKIESNLRSVMDCMKYFLDNPQKLSNAGLNDDEVSYYLQLFSNLYNDAGFKAFLDNISIKDFVYVVGEPHLVINFDCTVESNFIINYYLKALSFILRHNNQGGFNIPSDTNIMFYTIKGGDVLLYPSERGVKNGINFDQTGACGTGTIATGFYLLQQQDTGEINITNRSGITLQVQKDEFGDFKLISQESNIKRLKPKDKTFLNAEGIVENFMFNMYNIGINPEDKSYREIIGQIEKPQASQTINETFSDIIFSTCLHESEYPIDPYKISSSVNASIFAERLGIKSIYSPYLDTIANAPPKGFPNVNTKNGKIFKKIESLVQKLKEMLKDGEITIKDILKYLKSRNNITNTEETIQNEKLPEILNEIEELFEIILGIKQNNKKDSEFGKYILSYLSRTGIIEIFYEHLKNLNKEKIDQMLVEILGKNTKNKIHDIFELFVRSLLKINSEDIKPSTITKIINKSLQDSVLTYIFNSLDDDLKQLLKEKGVLDNRYRFNKPISSMDNYLKENLANSFKAIINDSDLGIDIILEYLQNVFEKKGKLVLLGEFNDKKNGFSGIKLYFLKEKDEYKIKVGKDKESFEVSTEYFLSLITNPENIINLQGVLFLFILVIGMIPMFGSERGYRDILVETLKQHFGPEKYGKYVEYLENSLLVSDYEPGKKYYYKLPSGTDNTYCGDLLMEATIAPKNLSKEKLEEFLQNNISSNGLDDKQKLQFLRFVVEITDDYNYNHIIDSQIQQAKSHGNSKAEEKLKEIKSIVNYTGDNIDMLVNCIGQRYLLIKNTNKGTT